MPNHLKGESSPYLLQHADNPVDWFPWGPEALEKARVEDKPIFLSIGYSACHWCHVMERESFEDGHTASFLNERFVSIKVDREERPDLDAVYMEAVRALVGQGGWPLSVWLTPDGAPFFGGTYYPPVPRQGMPSFLQVLQAVAEAWQSRRGDLARTAAAVRDHLQVDEAACPSVAGTEKAGRIRVDRDRILSMATDSLHETVDRVDGGWGNAPKFPQPLVLEYLLALLTVRQRPELQEDVEVTLDAMAAGGMYDHLGGGFHRYSTDGHWLVPHFEKMLYDNAQLARCYLHAWQSLEKPRYRTVAVETLDYLLREMRHPAGGFFSAQDADTVEGEGAFFTWTPAEIDSELPPDQAADIKKMYQVTTSGNFEGRNILHLSHGPGGRKAGAPEEAQEGPGLAAARQVLLRRRDSRPRPARDEKILTGWNGLALAAFAEASSALDSDSYRQAAEQTGDFLLAELMRRAPGGRSAGGPFLAHSWKDGRLSGEAFLDDYACAADGLLALYQCALDERWFAAARSIVDRLVERFRRPAGGFYDTSTEHETLITRPRAEYDSPTPTGNSMAATVLLKMAAYTGEDRYRELGEEALDSLADQAAAAPVMSGQWLTAALMAAEGVTEVAVVGDLFGPEGRALLAAVRDGFRPFIAFAARPAGRPTPIPLLQRREPQLGVSAAAWVCRHSTCAAPTSDPRELLQLMERKREPAADLG